MEVIINRILENTVQIWYNISKFERRPSQKRYKEEESMTTLAVVIVIGVILIMDMVLNQRNGNEKSFLCFGSSNCEGCILCFGCSDCKGCWMCQQSKICTYCTMCTECYKCYKCKLTRFEFNWIRVR